jgi:hypothetical protein
VGLGSLKELRNWFAERVDITPVKENSGGMALTKVELQLVAEYIQSLESDNQTTSETDLPPIDTETREQLEQAVPSEGWVAESRADEILKMYDVLRQRGEADKNVLLAVADPNAAEYGSTESMWSNMVEDRDTLRALPGVEAPPDGKETWEYSDK